MNERWVRTTREDVDPEVLSESALAMAQATIQIALDQSKLSRADLARQMDRPRSFISRMLSGEHNLTVKTMARALAACGYEMELGLTPIRWNWVREDAQPVKCINNTVPSLEGTLPPASCDSLAVECPLGRMGLGL